MNSRSSPDAAAAFEKLRSLVGEWRGETPAGAPVEVTYRLSAGDSVLVETWDLGPARESMTVYHLDGPDLMATHFCPQGNQPRLKLIQSAGRRFDFAFHDATGVLPGQGVQRAFWIQIGSDGRSRAARPMRKAASPKRKLSATSGRLVSRPTPAPCAIR